MRVGDGMRTFGAMHCSNRALMSISLAIFILELYLMFFSMYYCSNMLILTHFFFAFLEIQTHRSAKKYDSIKVHSGLILRDTFLLISIKCNNHISSTHNIYPLLTYHDPIIS